MGFLFLVLYPIYKSTASRDIQSADSMTGVHQWPSWQCIGARNILQPHEICNVISLVSTYIWVDNPDINTLSETHIQVASIPPFLYPMRTYEKMFENKNVSLSNARVPHQDTTTCCSASCAKVATDHGSLPNFAGQTSFRCFHHVNTIFVSHKKWWYDNILWWYNTTSTVYTYKYVLT